MSIPLGKLEKMLIMANGESIKTYRVLINPESFTVDYRTEYVTEDQAAGTSGKEVKYLRTIPPNLEFTFLFDNTGLIDLAPRLSIAQDLKDFKDLLFKFDGEAHRSREIKLVWGDALIYNCVATDLRIEYKLFNPAGMPIRAVATATFKGSIEDRKRTAEEKKSSPDLTHVRQVKAGDTLPLMCKRIYGDSRYYLQVAEANGIGNFRQLTPGMEIVFPPIDKTIN